MYFRILGSTEVVDGSRRVELPTGRGRSLLALLILHAGQPVGADRIIDELWGEDPPRTAGTVVQGLVSRLRRALEPLRARGGPAELIKTVGSGYCLAIDPEAVDANRFKRLLDQARGATPEARSATLAEALSMWRGPALVEFTYQPFAQRAIAALEELRIDAIEDRIEADLSLRAGTDLVAELEEVIVGNPFRERLRGFLMLALHRAGRQAEALEVYRKTRTLFAEELGLEPGPALRELEAAIFRQDRALQLETATHVAQPSDAAPSSWLPRERRTVTVVAIDATPAADAGVDPEVLGHAGAYAARVAGRVLERHGARVERLLGDTLVAFFGFPLAHEDDALRAVRAALEVRTAVYALDDHLSLREGHRSRMRAGIEMGEIVVTGPAGALQDMVRGPVIVAAGRLLQAAGDAEVIVGRAAAHLLRGRVILKPVELAADGEKAAWRVLEVVAGAPTGPRAIGALMFGRQDELTRLRSAFARTVRTGAVVRMTILGEAGIGKSRLARELAVSIGADANVITLRCPSDAEGVFFPLRQAMVEAAGIRGWRSLYDLLASDDHGRPLPEIADAMQLPAERVNAAALFPAMRRLFETLASERPLAVVFEDLHWADVVVLDLVDYLQREATGRILLLCQARPDVIERRPDWERADVLQLGPLSADDLESLVVDRAGSIDAETKHRIVETADGNPLFAEQLLAALDDATGDEIPGSLRALLTMRLDRLGPGERDSLRSASVVGMEFDYDAVCALLPDDARPFVERHLDALRRKHLVEPADTGGFRFRHSLIRLAAQQSMTRGDRAILHERLARWFQHDLTDRVPELTQTIAYHLAQADFHRSASGKAASRRMGSADTGAEA
jgi:DNA-binding SARP family transcriptional activator